MGHLEHKLYLQMLSLRPAESSVSGKEFFFTESSTNTDRGLSQHNYLKLTSRKHIFALMFTSDSCQINYDGSKGI
ncbi:hypothetical protein E2320_021222 [Naja naja]|nr:hypothetical protein E2320_021222 [Naja naja]